MIYDNITRDTRVDLQLCFSTALQVKIPFYFEIQYNIRLRLDNKLF